jgi:glycosidase
MDQVLAYWQSFGIDGFRCDVAHMVPAEFWNWEFARARARRPDAFFMGEAYPNDPVEVPGVDPVISKLAADKYRVMVGLLNAGFNAVYGDPSYRAIKKIYEQSAWANDIDDARPPDFVADSSLFYAENHDEVRLASKSQWAGVGKKAGPAICAILYGLSRGPVMLYSGQEVGEPADGVEGFGANDSRTSIFDYWSMPEFVKWVDGHKYDGARLSEDQKQLRASYGRLLNLLGEPAFRDGDFVPLNALNKDNPKFGRLPNEKASGHWLYAFLRSDLVTGQKFLVVVNLNSSVGLTDVRVKLPPSIFSRGRQSSLVILDRLNQIPLVDLKTTIGFVQDSGIPIGEMPPATACYLEIEAR